MTKKIKKVCINKDCRYKGKSLELNKFNKGSRVCKKCHSKRVLNDRDNRINKKLAELIDKEVIKADELESANLLFKSCYRAIEDCTKNKGLYRNVSIAWNDPLLMMEDLIMKKKRFWEAWKEQSEIYFKSNKMLSARATLDRIQEDGNYTLDNIQMLSHGENSKKAHVKPLNVIVMDINGNKTDDIKCKSVKEAVDALKIKHPIHAFIDSGKTYSHEDGRILLFKSRKKSSK
ncbi:hypothetical protein [Metabacillus fastidiosus]|uniref:hypothetical protein n=1 Tax=Metabacillus fastidiosus TaxID=1458 RepID=UPI002DB70145|nr:hypothetical protein [Metabacillus fastidiosus]MEC2077683.1 hypothetical protein [Metabacillus fastidiosus]